MNRPALFLDRDGVINLEQGYVHTPEEFKFIDGIFDLVAAANNMGYLVVVVTNQAGIGRGFYSEADFHALTNWMKARFTERGGRIDAVYFSPYHPKYGVGKYRRESDCRKPSPGMLLQAKRELDIDLSKSIFIGDSLKDIQASNAAGVGTTLFLNNHNNGLKCELYIEISDLRSALKYLLEIDAYNFRDKHSE